MVIAEPFYNTQDKNFWFTVVTGNKRDKVETHVF